MLALVGHSWWSLITRVSWLHFHKCMLYMLGFGTWPVNLGARPTLPTFGSSLGRCVAVVDEISGTQPLCSLFAFQLPQVSLVGLLILLDPPCQKISSLVHHFARLICCDFDFPFAFGHGAVQVTEWMDGLAGNGMEWIPILPSLLPSLLPPFLPSPCVLHKEDKRNSAQI